VSRSIREAILGAWKVLEGAGLRRPWGSDLEVSNALDTWGLVLADVEPGRLLVMAAAWLRSPEARFGRWPMPGALLHALGDNVETDEADEAWGEVLALLQSRGRDWCCRSVPTVLHLVELEAAMRERTQELRTRGDALLAEQQERRRQGLPKGPEARLVAVFAGLSACGGWRGLAVSEDLVTHRAAFRAAFRGTAKRRQLEGQEASVAALLGGGGPRPRLLAGGRP